LLNFLLEAHEIRYNNARDIQKGFALSPFLVVRIISAKTLSEINFQFHAPFNSVDILKSYIIKSFYYKKNGVLVLSN